MTARAKILVMRRGHVCHLVKMHYFFISLLLSIDQTTKYIVVMTMEESTKIVYFITLRVEVVVLWSYWCYNENA